MVLRREKFFLRARVFFIQWNGSTLILTSASLVRIFGEENKIVENLTVGALRFSAISGYFNVLLKSHHCIICRFKCCFQTADAKKGC
jgi:hypothetical protein